MGCSQSKTSEKRARAEKRKTREVANASTLAVGNADLAQLSERVAAAHDKKAAAKSAKYRGLKITIGSYDDLPSKIVRDVAKAGIPFGECDRHLHILANVLRFTHKLRITLENAPDAPYYAEMHRAMTEGGLFDHTGQGVVEDDDAAELSDVDEGDGDGDGQGDAATEQADKKVIVEKQQAMPSQLAQSGGLRISGHHRDSRSTSRRSTPRASGRSSPPTRTASHGPPAAPSAARARALSQGGGQPRGLVLDGLRKSSREASSGESSPVRGRSRSRSLHKSGHRPKSAPHTPRGGRRRGAPAGSGDATSAVPALADQRAGVSAKVRSREKALSPRGGRSDHTGLSTPAATPLAAAERERTLRRYDPAMFVVGEEELMSTEHLDAQSIFSTGEMVGKGGYGKVFKATETLSTKAKRQVALKKMLHSTEKEKVTNLNEIGCLRHFLHPNIVTFHRAFIVTPPEKRAQCWISMELLEGGTLQQASRSTKFTPEHCAFVAREMLTGIAFMHKLGYAHRDLKSANVMLSIKAEVKLIDFGLSTRLSDKKEVRHMVGSPFWMPPEMVRREAQTFAVDSFSLAISIWEMFDQKAPNSHNKVKALFVIGTGQLKVPTKVEDTPYGRFMTRCLEPVATKRALAKDLLSDPYLETAVSVEDMSMVLRETFLRKHLELF
uniref:Protein kinase domain-containing protein n=1 Tax=Sexangularia sp. CB-2014 TaxID=1486929 RepID=A0A7S1YET0_9EUKA|mmetsp:Transcript_3912/g.12671  ORF Transcript_3912/g.12671 Transcript_3912/m.12671 type:complete len:668 (+) Transcript_3912:120-2123(+)